MSRSIETTTNETQTGGDYPFTRFLNWFEEGVDANGEPMPDLYDLNHVRMLYRTEVFPSASAKCSAFDEQDIGKSVFVVEYDRGTGEYVAADFVVREAADMRLRVDLFDIFKVEDGQMSYVRESKGHPEALTFEFETHVVHREGAPYEDEVTWAEPRDVEWLWPLVECAYGTIAEAA